MYSAKAIFSTLVVVTSIGTSVGAAAQQMSMDAAREQRMDMSLQDFRAAHPDMGMGSSAATNPMTSMTPMHNAHRSDRAMRHHPGTAAPMRNHRKSATAGAAPMAGGMTGSPKAATQ